MWDRNSTSTSSPSCSPRKFLHVGSTPGMIPAPASDGTPGSAPARFPDPSTTLYSRWNTFERLEGIGLISLPEIVSGSGWLGLSVANLQDTGLATWRFAALNPSHTRIESGKSIPADS